MKQAKTKDQKDLMKRIKAHMPFYFFVLPALILVIVFNYLPMGGLVIAFKNHKMAR